MILEMKVPSPGESITEVEIAQWLVAEGDYVEKDQPIAEVDSDKATLELPAEESGTITFKAEEGDAVGVGQVVCLIDTEGKPSGDDPVKASDAVQAPAAPAEKEAVSQATYASGSASPAAKKVLAEKGIDANYASKLIQYGWETITESLKHGGITTMMDRLSNPAKIRAFEISETLKGIMKPLFVKHMDDIMSGYFSKTMMEDWANDDVNLLKWRAATGETAFEKTAATNKQILEQDYFDHGVLMVAFVRAGVELAFETMVSSGIVEESAYYESLHELPLIANTVARKKLFEMNRIISDTAEYGCYLFDHACKPLLVDFMKTVETDVIGTPFTSTKNVDNQELIRVNDAIRNHPIEATGKVLRTAMTAMKVIKSDA